MAEQGRARSSEGGAHLAYRPDIDGLRAIAVLSVVLFHAGIPGFPGGFTGVDIFFVISGYLITSLILKDVAGGFSFVNFYLRRAKRIFPALIVVLVATTVASWFILFPDELKKFGRSLAATTIFGSNFYFAQDVGYFSAPVIEKPLLHTWSLAIEEQFYILFPAALTFCLPRLGRARWLIAMIAVAAASIVTAEILVRQGSQSVFFMPHARAWELLLGAIVATGQDRVAFGRIAGLALSVAGLALLALAVGAIGPETPFPGFSAALPCFGAAALLLAGAKHRGFVQAALSVAPMRFFGKISYSLYLWHWPVFSLATYHLNRTPDATETALLIAISIVLATISWRFVEQPIRTGALGFDNPWRGIRLTALPFAPLAIIGLMLVATNGFPWRLPAALAAAYEQSKTKPSLLSQCGDATDSRANAECQFGAPPKDGQYEMVIWGDSHARAMLPAVDKIAKANGLAGWQITPSACAPLLDVTVLDRDHTARHDCTGNSAAMRRFVEKNKRLKVVFIVAKWVAYNSRDDSEGSEVYLVRSPDEKASVSNSRRLMGEELQRTVDYFTSRGIDVVIFGQVPEFPFAPVRCNLRKMLYPASAPDCTVPAAEQQRYLAYPNGVIARLRADPHLIRIFAHELLCDAATCKSAAGGQILYRDGNHLNAYGAELFRPLLTEKLKPVLADAQTTATQ